MTAFLILTAVVIIGGAVVIWTELRQRPAPDGDQDPEPNADPALMRALAQADAGEGRPWRDVWADIDSITWWCEARLTDGRPCKRPAAPGHSHCAMHLGETRPVAGAPSAGPMD